MTEIDFIKENKKQFLQYFHSNFPIFHLSNVFYLDIRYAAKYYLISSHFKVSDMELEGITNALVSEMISDGIFKPVSSGTWTVNYPDFRAKRLENRFIDRKIFFTNKFSEEKMAEVLVAQHDITISDKAASEIKKVMQENNIPEGSGLRMGVKGGGCSGFSYVLGFDEKSAESDKIFDANGVKVFIDERSLPYLAGIVLDYQDGLSGKGFTFDNPNATRTCGCGHSFDA